jgi:hypothetical protein
MQIGIEGGRVQIIKRREGDYPAPLTTTVEQAEILGVSVSVANDQVEDRGIEKFQDFARGACCCAAQQRETVLKDWPAFASVFAVRGDAERLGKVFLMEAGDATASVNRPVVAGNEQE